MNYIILTGDFLNLLISLVVFIRAENGDIEIKDLPAVPGNEVHSHLVKYPGVSGEPCLRCQGTCVVVGFIAWATNHQVWRDDRNGAAVS
jgi:hypothetical protein